LRYIRDGYGYAKKHQNRARDERIVVCGPSGSGKSTMIRCINRLEEHQRGKIIVDGIELTNDIKHIDQVRSEVGMVFQHFNLFPHLTVLENCCLALVWVRKMPRKEVEAIGMQYLERVKIPEQDLTEARQWVAGFVHWYNHDHRHSAIQFVTPAQRHAGLDTAILSNRKVVYEAAKARRSERWSRETRKWDPVLEMYLNPDKSLDNERPDTLEKAA